MQISRINHPRRTLLIILITLLVVGVASYFIFWHHTIKVTSVPSTTKQQDEAAVKKGVSQKNSNSTQSSGSDKQTNSSSSSSSTATTPQGNFVSSHHVNLSSTIESVCVTSKGTTCEITFTQNGNTKSLGTKTVDSNGSATWLWTPASINLSAGTWEINATATLNGAQSTAKDPLNLEVSP